jgi:hypothetical protein
MMPAKAELSLAFRLHSRNGCMVEYLLAQPHRCSPFDLLTILQEPSNAEGIKQKAGCLHSPIAVQFMTENPDLAGKDSRVQILVICIVSRTDISNLESLHAWIRRVLHTRVQTHGLSLDDCSALWVLRRQRSALPDGPPASRKRKQPADDQAQNQPEPKPKPKRKPRKMCHNSYHLFCRQA